LLEINEKLRSVMTEMVEQNGTLQVCFLLFFLFLSSI